MRRHLAEIASSFLDQCDTNKWIKAKNKTGTVKNPRINVMNKNAGGEKNPRKHMKNLKGKKIERSFSFLKISKLF